MEAKQKQEQSSMEADESKQLAKMEQMIEYLHDPTKRKPLDATTRSVKVQVVGPYGVKEKPRYYPFEQNKVIIIQGGKGQGIATWSPTFTTSCFTREKRGLFRKKLTNDLLTVRVGAPRCIDFQNDLDAPGVTKKDIERIAKFIIDERMFKGIKAAIGGQGMKVIEYIILIGMILMILMMAGGFGYIRFK